MKDDESLPTTETTLAATAVSATSTKEKTGDSSLFGRGRYKFWALAAILLLAFWSMFTGTVTLRWSAGNLNRMSDNLGPPAHEDLDVLVSNFCFVFHFATSPFYLSCELVVSAKFQILKEMEEREKVVKHMWDVYTNSRRIRLPRFWREAFEAAYGELTSDLAGVREAAISEIAKMSLSSVNLDPPPIRSTSVRELSKSLRQPHRRRDKLS